jgi:hypothetical protein
MIDCCAAQQVNKRNSGGGWSTGAVKFNQSKKRTLTFQTPWTDSTRLTVWAHRSYTMREHGGVWGLSAGIGILLDPVGHE